MIDHAIVARPDLGHLWYVCTDLQVFLFLLAVVYLLGSRRKALLAALLAITVAVLVWRDHVYDVDGVYAALLRTTTRMDSMIWGAAAATALPYLEGLRPRTATTGAIALVALAPLAYYANDNQSYFGFAGVCVNIAAALFVTCSMLVDPRPTVTRVLGWRPLSWLGQMSLAFYIWHYPVFWAVSRHTVDWSWFPRTLVALTITTGLALLAQRLVERPIQRWLRSPRWAAYDQGIVAGLAGRLRSRADARADRAGSEHSA